LLTTQISWDENELEENVEAFQYSKISYSEN
jgi:hypothetical protein